jgi:hypothetical protein
MGPFFLPVLLLLFVFHFLLFSSFPSSYRINLIVYLCCPAPVVWLDLPTRLSLTVRTSLIWLEPCPPAFYGALFSSRFALAVCFSLLSFSSFPSSYRINLIVYLCCPAFVVWLDLPIRLSLTLRTTFLLLVEVEPCPPAFYGALFSSRFALAVCFSLLAFSYFSYSYRINLIVYSCCPAPVVWLDLPTRLARAYWFSSHVMLLVLDMLRALDKLINSPLLFMGPFFLPVLLLLFVFHFFLFHLFLIPIL